MPYCQGIQTKIKYLLYSRLHQARNGPCRALVIALWLGCSLVRA